jgi:uncharacterized protein YkwD
MTAGPSPAAELRRLSARPAALPLTTAFMVVVVFLGFAPRAASAQEAAPPAAQSGAVPSEPGEPAAPLPASSEPADPSGSEAPPASAEAAPPPEAAVPDAAPPASEVPASASPDPAAVAADPGLDDRSRMELAVLALVNQARAQHGLPPLTLDNRLVAAAREHAVDMARGRFCRHNGRDGSKARDRMRRNGYPYNNWAGENIICSRRSAEAMVQWWLNSPPHRRNILHGHFRHIGVGVSMNGQWGADGVLVFAAGADETMEADVFKAFREGRLADWVAATGER